MVFGVEVGWGTGIIVATGIACVDAGYLYWGLLRLPRGFSRLVASVPVLITYAVLPLIFNSSSHLIGIGVYFCFFTWVATFKVLLLCWDKGPGSEPWVLESYVRFTVVMHLPIHVTRRGRFVKRKLDSASWWENLIQSESGHYLAARCFIKLLVMAGMVKVYAYRHSIPLAVLELTYSVNLYLFVTVVLEGLAAVSAALFGVEVEPHFDNPFAASSLEDFWARRWNLVISGMLREAVYEPALLLLTSRSTEGRQAESSTSHVPPNTSNKTSTNVRKRKEQPSSRGNHGKEATVRSKPERDAVPSKATRFVAMLLTFLVSGIMHELAVFYMTSYLSGQMTAFFTLHGLATGLQVACKPYVRKVVKIPLWLSILLTLSFTFTTAVWLFYAPLVSTGADVQVTSELVQLLRTG